jgi:cobalt-zinc-cadmium efflux system outer membrane protein
MYPLKIYRTSLLSAPILFIIAFNAAATEPRELSLSQAIQRALAHNPDLRMSALGVDAAGAAVDVASAKPNPTLTLQTLGINPNMGIGAGSLRSKIVDSTVRLDQLIERGGKRDYRIDAARGLEKAARDDARDARRRLRQVVSQAYYDVLAARDKLEFTRQGAELFDGSVRAAQQRQRAGDLAAADVMRAQVDALRAHNDTIQAESDLYTMRQSLLSLMGQSDDRDAVEPSDSWPVSPPPVAPLADAVLQQRPDVLAAQSRLDAALAAHKLALASRSADITVGIQAEHFPASANNGQGSGNSYGVAVQIPIFIRYMYAGEIRSADVAADIARENLDKVRAMARSELRVSTDHVRVAYERLRRYDDELLIVAKKSADAAEFAFAHGALGIMDLLDVRRTYRSAQLDALAARAAYAKSLTEAQAAAPESPIQ